jgi:hypothetical protein
MGFITLNILMRPGLKNEYQLKRKRSPKLLSSSHTSAKKSLGNQFLKGLVSTN